MVCVLMAVLAEKFKEFRLEGVSKSRKGRQVISPGNNPQGLWLREFFKEFLFQWKWNGQPEN